MRQLIRTKSTLPWLCLIITIGSIVHLISLPSLLSIGLFFATFFAVFYLYREFHQAPNAVQSQNDYYKDSFVEVAIGLTHVSLDGRFLRVNRHLCALLGYSQKEFLKLSFQTISLAEDVPESLNWIKNSIEGNVSHSFSKIKRYRHKAGHLVWTKLTTTLVRDDDGKPSYFLSSIQDISDLKQTEAVLDDSLIKLKEAYFELQKVARNDGLTGALTVSAFKEHIHTAFEHFVRYKTPSTLVFIDLDRFKIINDTYGHLAGDAALKMLVNKLRSEARQTDVIGRYGGDEFAVLLSNSNQIQAKEFCDRVGYTFSAVDERSQPYGVSISVGISELSESITTVDQWLTEADKNMYRDKQATCSTSES